MTADTKSILKPMDQGLISTLKSYYWRNIFNKDTAAIHSDFFGGYGQNKLKTFWKRSTILDVIKSICYLWEEVKISLNKTLSWVWKKFILTFRYNLEEFKTSVEEVTADAVELARVQTRSEPDNVIELL